MHSQCRKNQPRYPDNIKLHYLLSFFSVPLQQTRALANQMPCFMRVTSNPRCLYTTKAADFFMFRWSILVCFLSKFEATCGQSCLLVPDPD